MDSSIISPFQFISYKVDKVSLVMRQDVSILASLANMPPNSWKIQIHLRLPAYIKKQNIYVGGLDVTLSLFSPNMREEEKPLVNVEAGIVGAFYVEKGRLPAEVEKQLVFIQIPAILLPYLRSTITGLLANSGFGSVIFPLINIHAYAKESLQNQQITVIE